MYRVLIIWILCVAAALALTIGQALMLDSPPLVGVLLNLTLILAAIPLAHRLAGRSRRRRQRERQMQRLFVA